VFYSISNNTVQPLVSRRISLRAWDFIELAVMSSGFWSNAHRCEEIAYREQSLYFPDNGACTEILMTDGASLSMAGANPTDSKGILTVCFDAVCSEYEQVAVTMLTAAGIRRSQLKL
jgi:hypothetical protein